MKKPFMYLAAALLSLTIGLAPASAALVVQGIDFVNDMSTDLTAFGFGSVNPIFTFQGPASPQNPHSGSTNVCTLPSTGSDPTLGCTPYSSAGVNIEDDIFGDVNPVSDPKYTQPTLGDLGIMGYNEIGILFNVNEPQSLENITLHEMFIAFWSRSGDNFTLEGVFTLLPEEVGEDFVNLSQGQGSAGFVGIIDPNAILAANSMWNSFNQDWYITAGANTSNSENGPESVTVARIPGGDLPSVPEPSTYLMFGAGLLLTDYCRRRRSKK